MYISEISKTFFFIISNKIANHIERKRRELSLYTSMTTSVIYSLVTLSSIFFFIPFALSSSGKSHSSFPFIAICVALCKYNIHFLFSYITLGTSILGHIHIFPSPFSRSLFFIVVKCLAKLQVLLYVTHVKLGYFFNSKFAHPRSMKIFYQNLIKIMYEKLLKQTAEELMACMNRMVSDESS